MALIVDDRVRGRDHRRNIFNPNYKAAGAATVRMPDTTVFAVSILPVATPRARSYVSEPMPRIRFNDATLTIGRGAAEAALFRESVERMDRP
jgi:hypothetical protein